MLTKITRFKRISGFLTGIGLLLTFISLEGFDQRVLVAGVAMIIAGVGAAVVVALMYFLQWARDILNALSDPTP